MRANCTNRRPRNVDSPVEGFWTGVPRLRYRSRVRFRQGIVSALVRCGCPGRCRWRILNAERVEEPASWVPSVDSCHHAAQVRETWELLDLGPSASRTSPTSCCNRDCISVRVTLLLHGPVVVQHSFVNPAEDDLLARGVRDTQRTSSLLVVDEHKEEDLGRREGSFQRAVEFWYLAQFLRAVHGPYEDPRRGGGDLFPAEEAVDASQEIIPHLWLQDVMVPEATTPLRVSHEVALDALVPDARASQEVRKICVQQTNDALYRRPNPVERVRVPLQPQRLQTLAGGAVATEADELSLLDKAQGSRVLKPQCRTTCFSSVRRQPSFLSRPFHDVDAPLGERRVEGDPILTADADPLLLYVSH